MAEPANCSECGALYMKTVLSICTHCHQARERRFQTVYQFLKANRAATIMETVIDTGVSEADILEFIRQGRLQPTDLPNFHTPCDFCGQSTRNGRLCSICEKRLQEEIADVYNTKETYSNTAYYNDRFMREQKNERRSL
ncbi:hypothetical protein [Natribacillus halophilus]|uniref:Flagellar operon protein TIGR03826 n=1 Tax=Natribacillus halophilus TaxID=549003 RepID=A0A1G8KNR5_9BACI|nr:hypothetical protein [Natribacillus halophilus]SDI45111.1 flagellar operon protein TIGR03826 [Natribacillus halophilus]